MEFEYDNDYVKKLFSDFQLMKKKTDGTFTKLVKKRCDQLRAFDTFADFFVSKLGKPHRLSGDRSDFYAVHITGNKRLIIKPLSENLSPDSLKKCRKILIKGVEDYHGSKTKSYIP